MTLPELIEVLAAADDTLDRIDLDNPADGLAFQVAFIVRDAVSAVKRAREMVSRTPS